jgi:signal transduction histidine kinase
MKKHKQVIIDQLKNKLGMGEPLNQNKSKNKVSPIAPEKEMPYSELRDYLPQPDQKCIDFMSLMIGNIIYFLVGLIMYISGAVQTYYFIFLPIFGMTITIVKQLAPPVKGSCGDRTIYYLQMLVWLGTQAAFIYHLIECTSMLLMAVALVYTMPSLPIFSGGSLVHLLNILIKDLGIPIILGCYVLAGKQPEKTASTSLLISKPMQFIYSIFIIITVRSFSFFKKKQKVANFYGYIQLLDSVLTEFFELLDVMEPLGNIPNYIGRIEQAKKQDPVVKESTETEMMSERTNRKKGVSPILSQVKPSLLDSLSSLSSPFTFNDALSHTYPTNETRIVIRDSKRPVRDEILSQVVKEFMNRMDFRFKHSRSLLDVWTELNETLLKIDGGQLNMEDLVVDFLNLRYVDEEIENHGFDMRMIQFDRSHLVNQREQFRVYISVTEPTKPKTVLKSAMKKETFRQDTMKNEELTKSVTHKDQGGFTEEGLSVVVHDMRNPLMCIQSNLETTRMKLEDQAVFDEVGTMLQSSIAACNLLETLVNDILDSTRIAKGIFQLNISKINLKKLIVECLEIMKVAAKGRKNKLLLEYKGREEINTDPQRLKQVLLNFLSNSIKFTKEGEIVVFVVQNMDLIQIGVRDSGNGMNKETLSKLFQKFNSERNSQNSKGIGLGLFICKSIIEKLGPLNSINVKSELGKGTEISFKIFSHENGNTFDFDSSDSNIRSSREVQNDKFKGKNSLVPSIFTYNEAYSYQSKKSVLEHMKSRNLSFVSQSRYQTMKHEDPGIAQVLGIPPVESQSMSDLEVQPRPTVRIVLMDDDAFITEAVISMISLFFLQTPGVNHVITTFDNVTETLEFLLEHKCNLALLDNSLSDGTGRALVTTYKRMKASTGSADQDSPIFILCTGDEAQPSDSKLFTKVLTKPIRMDSISILLQRTIESIVKGSKSLDNWEHIN